MKNKGYQHQQAGWIVTACMFLAGFIVGAAAVTTYFWATGQLKRTIYLGVSPPAATKPAPHPPAPTPHPPAPAPHPPASVQPVAPAAPVLPQGGPAAPVAPSATSATAAPAGAQSADVQYLAQRHLLIPVAGVRPQALHDDFNDSRGGRRHEAIDIMAPAGTPVVACDDGHIAKLFTSRRGGLTIYEDDPSRTYTYYYAHLSHYAAGLQEHAAVKRGQVIGYVGSSGDASTAAPHLHFAINRLPASKDWWQGTPIDPYPFLANLPMRH